MRRRDLVALLAAIALIAGAKPAHDADYPNRPVRVIVPYPAGGPTDLIARLAAQMLTESLGQDFFVENVSGASGVRGALMVAYAANAELSFFDVLGRPTPAAVLDLYVEFLAMTNGLTLPADPDGKREYAARQREFAARGEALRRRLLEACTAIRVAAACTQAGFIARFSSAVIAQFSCSSYQARYARTVLRNRSRSGWRQPYLFLRLR